MIDLNTRIKRLIKKPYFEFIKHYFEKFPIIRKVYPAWFRTHPFDVRFGTDTSGFVSTKEIHPDKAFGRLINPYAASQPSIIRQALSALANIEDYTFIDLGCGKGRVLIVGSEFPFREIVGIELSASLTEIARANIARAALHSPCCTNISVHAGNVLDFPLPKGKLVVFIYHSFGQELMSRMLERLETSLSSGATEHLYMVYYNPFHGSLFDASPAFTRWYAETIPYDASELGYGPDRNDAVVIWQSVKGARLTPHTNVHRRIVNTPRTRRANLTK